MKVPSVIFLVLFASLDVSAQGWEMLGPDSVNWRNVRRITGRWFSQGNFTLAAETYGGVPIYSSGGEWDYRLRNSEPGKFLPRVVFSSVEFSPWEPDSVWIGYNIIYTEGSPRLLKFPFPYPGPPFGGATIGGNCWFGPLSILFSKDSIVYGGACGIHKSFDRGNTWQVLQSEVPSGESQLLAIDSQNENVLYKTWNQYFGGPDTLLKSVDAGGSWFPVFSPLPRFYNSGAGLVSLGDTVILSLRTWWTDTSAVKGIFRSVDGGTTWRHVYSLFRVGGLTRSKISNDVLFAASEEGILRSSDAGQTWLMHNNGLPTTRITSILADPYSDTLYVSTETHGVLKVWNFLVGVDDGESSPAGFALSQNYPNPFNPSTRIEYQLPRKDLVTLRVYDVLGREVAVLVNEVQSPGTHSAKFSATVLASGVYFYRLESGGFVETKRLVLLR